MRLRRVLVLGARGHFGAQVLAAARRRPELEAVGASRRPAGEERRVDLHDESTFDSLAEFDVIANVSDSAGAPPRAAAASVVARGGLWLETSADARIHAELAELSGPGTVVLGAGAFPGLSTHLLEAAPAGASLEFRASWSVWSGAGDGTIEVMVDALSRPNLGWRHGREEVRPTLQPVVVRRLDGQPMAFVGLPMPDVVLAGERGHPDVLFLAGVRPRLPRTALAATSWLAARGCFRPRVIRTAARWALGGLRTRLLASRSTTLTLELYASPERATDPVASVRTADAFRAGAAHLACLAARWPDGRSGARLPHEGVSLADLAADLGSEATFRFASASGAGDR